MHDHDRSVAKVNHRRGVERLGVEGFDEADRGIEQGPVMAPDVDSERGGVGET
jgi:hypothetical protein